MDKNEKKFVQNPRQGANPLSVITFKWLSRIFRTGYKRELEVSDLYSPLDGHSSQLLGNKISHLWSQEIEKSKKLKKLPSLFKVLLRGFGCSIMLWSLGVIILEIGIRTTRPLVLAKLLQYFRDDYKMERTEAYYWSTCMVLGLFLDTLIDKITSQEMQHFGMKMRVACCSLIYRKILKVPKVASKGKTSIGQMINLLSNDVNRFDTATIILHYAWIAPIQTVLISYLLYREVGLAAFGGIIILFLLILIHGFCGKVISRLMAKIASRTDERLRLINQIISGVQVIKMYAWEKPFAYLADKAREKEVKIIRNNTMIVQMCLATENFIPQVCLFVTVLIYILFGNDIEAEKVYLVTAYYNILRLSLCRFFPISIGEAAGAVVSIKRLNEYLLLEELAQKSLENINNNVNSAVNDDVSLSLDKVTVKWNSESKLEALRQISFQLQRGTLTAVIGQVGAGKTTLFQTILQEIPDVRGEVKINGKISYASQEPWLFTSTIRQNILFGKPMDQERYGKVVEVCQLKRDYELLPYGENTLVGEKGINLSGGQCARINLARAVYHEADIYLLDDPLSAVDAHVSKAIFEECIETFLKGKTVLLNTHQYHYLKRVDRIIVLGEGGVLADGSYANLVNSGINLMNVTRLESEADSPGRERTPAKEDGAAVAESIAPSNIEEELSESRTVGGITVKTYLDYFKVSRNGFLVFVVFFTSVLCQFFKSVADYFLTYWVNVEQEGNITAQSSGDLLRGRDLYIYVYASIIFLSVPLTAVQAYTFCQMCMKISRNLHAMMFTNIIKTKMSFFNSNPIGRIMNRFSKDMGLVDIRIPQTMTDITHAGLYSLAVIIIVATVNPWFLIAALVIAIAGYFFRRFYIKTSRSIKRLEGITRSPVFNHLSASVHGLTTIRALHAEKILTSEFDNYQDVHSSAWYLFFSGSLAFGMYIEFLCTAFTGIVIYTLLSLTDVVLAGDVGLVITQCLLLTGIVQWGMRQTTELENQMTSVERILEYSKLEREPLLERRAASKGPENWPQQGQLRFKDVSLTYARQEKPALSDLNFAIEPRQMIGIVGRTGAGKSSIITALFRLADIEGEIYIDNVATSTIALQDLRSKISIIPQEPVLFAGTLRKNLDPFEGYSDDALWQALEKVEMKALLQSDLGLSMKVAEEGMNFSVGQRQLLCLARAIIRNNKLLVLDEATANVDPQTDELIQKAVRRNCDNCTVLIIAHRLNTVMDSDKILVMDAGKVVEFDHPYNLLQEKSGVFYSMVQQTGASTAEHLFQIAKLNYENSTHGTSL